jgi:anti-anti-sigma regulatory factor
VTGDYQYFRIEHVGEVTILTLTIFDFFDQVANAETKRELIRFAQAEKPQKLIISFEHVQRFSSEFIGTLVSLKKQMRSLHSDAAIKLCTMQPTHREVFKLIDPNQALFKIHDAVSDAYESF